MSLTLQCVYLVIVCSACITEEQSSSCFDPGPQGARNCRTLKLQRRQVRNAELQTLLPHPVLDLDNTLIQTSVHGINRLFLPSSFTTPTRRSCPLCPYEMAGHQSSSEQGQLPCDIPFDRHRYETSPTRQWFFRLPFYVTTMFRAFANEAPKLVSLRDFITLAIIPFAKSPANAAGVVVSTGGCILIRII